MHWTISILLAAVLAPALQGAPAEFPKQPGLKASHGIALIPEPQIARVTQDDFTLRPGALLWVDPRAADAPAVASLIAAVDLKRSAAPGAPGGIELRLVAAENLAGVPAGDAKKEGYTLTVTRGGVRIEAAFPAGLFYGVQTFLQLLEPGSGRVRGIRITDWPDLAFRAIHVCLWYHLDRPWYYEHLFRQLAHYKINTAVFEFEDKFGYQRHPVLSAPGALTPAAVKALVETARRYHIEIVPLVQTLGHVSFIVKHPEFAQLREVPMSNWQLCPLKKGTFELAAAILDEMIDAVRPAKYFHIGGDEARELGMGAECRQKWGERAAVESYRLWLQFVCAHLKKKGLTAIVWDDMFLRHFSPSDMTGMPDNLIYMRWDYSSGEIPARGRKLLDLGYPVWVATAAQTMTPVFPDQRLRVYNNANLIPSAIALGVKGALNTAWEDAGVHPETYWMGFLASAEYAWSSRKPAVAEYWDKFLELFHGRAATGLSKVYDTLSEKGFVRRENGWTREFEALEMPPLPDDNMRVAAAWRDKHRALVEEARQRRPDYEEAARVLTENLARDTKNKFSLEVMLLCAQTMRHFTGLVLAIDEINQNLVSAQAERDKGDPAAAINRYHHISRMIEDLRHARASLYAETVRVWETSTYPKDFRHIPGGRERFVHQVDRDFYYGNKTLDLNYIFEVEDKLGMVAYQQALQRLIVKTLRGSTPW